MVRRVLVQTFLWLFVVVAMAGAAASEWAFYGKSQDGSVTAHYDRANVVPLPDRMVRVTVKYVYDEVGKKKVIDSRKKSELPTTGYQKLSHSIVQYEMDCKKKQQAIFSVTELDEGGKELDHYDPQTRVWTPIKPGGIGEVLFSKVCAASK